jgi:hypothetical protein
VLDVGRDLERIRDYLAGRLSDEESEAFGERLVRDPQLVRELERTVGLSEGLRRAASERRPVALPQRHRRRAWLPGLAAAAAIGVLAVGLWVRSATERVPLLSASLGTALTREVAANAAAQFTFVAMRGGGTPVLALPAAGIVDLRAAAPAGSATGGYRVTLRAAPPGGAPRTLGSTTVADLQADGYLHVYVDAAHLGPGPYLLDVTQDGAAAASEAYPFILAGRGTTPP